MENHFSQCNGSVAVNNLRCFVFQANMPNMYIYADSKLLEKLEKGPGVVPTAGTSSKTHRMPKTSSSAGYFAACPKLFEYI